MQRLAATCGGFLLAIIWMDLMFDVQVRHLGGPAGTDAEILRSIATYYRRVTTDAFPMNRLIGMAMLLTVGTSVWIALRDGRRRRGRLLAVLLAIVPIGLALLRTFPNAVRLGSAADTFAVQTELARAILHDHVACFAAIAAFTFLQLRTGG